MNITYPLSEIVNTAAKVYEMAGDFKIWALHGEMGAGKTTFVHALCEYLQVSSTVGSPTYSIINEYGSPVKGTILHMDWYRLKNEEEALQAGVEDALYSADFCIIEWPDKAKDLLPDNTFHLYISLIDPSTRQLTFENIEK